MARMELQRAVAAMALLAVACGSANHASTLTPTPSAVGATSTPTSYPSPGNPSPNNASPSYPSPTYPIPPTASSTPTGQCPAVQPAPQFQPSAPSSRNLALVWLKGSGAFVVRDITDINHPFAVSTLNGIGVPRFASPSDVSFATDTELVRMPFSAYPRTTVASLCLGSAGFAWSPDGTTAAYVTDDQSRTGSMLHVVSGGQDRVVSSMPAFAWGVGCAGQCADTADERLLYSPDGAYISLVQTWGGPMFRVWTSDGRVLTAVDSGAPDSSLTMSAWSGSALYYRDGKGVEAWRNGTTSLILPGVKWIRPKASAAGGKIVYEARDSANVPNVYLLDTTTGTVKQIAASRSEPAFLTSRFIWYKGERPCTSTDTYPCNSWATTIESGTTYIYDLQTGTEIESIITKVWDVWPHPA
jgi:hypothetical protein